ncbi:hypothetical protein HDV04_001429 [Boothiomyces sp. JEL0838]|nr:hypothetical protein HDV04_001429 [Boothiomyces sp. JEL0838]
MESQEKKEQRLLKQKVEILERENYALKKSLYELSTKYNSMKLPPFALGELLHSLDNVDTLFETKEELGLKKQFYHKQELKGHQGAVYQVQYSNCGRWISSGSFDRTVRIWDPAQSKELHCLTGHALNISDLSWSDCSTELLSGGYDQTCKTWNVEQGKMLESFDSDGFVQCVQFNPQDKNIFFSGSSRNILAITDRRQPSSALALRNDSMVNTISVFQNGMFVMSGDANGYIKVWDVRTGACVGEHLNEPSKKPISHISTSFAEVDEEPRYIAVNSYDNILRVYDRGLSFSKNSFELIHSLKGHKNKNWPIRSAFYKTKEPIMFSAKTNDEMFSKSELPSETRDPVFELEKQDTNHVLATGSADPFIYLFLVGQTEGSSEMIQRLEGHTDRVYACHFHPSEPLLVSGSADFSVKIWSLNWKKRAK